MTIAVFSKACSKNVSGNTRIFVAESANVSAITVTAGEISGITGAGAFKEIETDFDTILRTEEKIAGKLNHAYDVSVDMKFAKPNTALNTLRDSLGDASPCGMIALVRDGNGEWWLVGYNELDLLTRPLYLSQDNFTSGAELIDPEGNKASVKLVRNLADASLPLDSTLADSIDDGTAVFCAYAAGYATEFQAVYDSWTTKPSAAIAAAMNAFVVGLIADGVWTKRDVFYLFAVHTNSANEALTNWANPGTYNAALAGSPNPSFAAYEGLTPDGANGYVTSNWNPNSEGINYLLNSSSVCHYLRNNLSEGNSKLEFGAYDGTNNITGYARRSGDVIDIRMNASAAADAGSNADTRGLFVFTRTGANVQVAYKNKVALVNGVAASNGIPNVDMYIGAYNNNGVMAGSCQKQIAMFFAGGGMTQTDVNSLTDRFETYMDSNGKGVIA